MSYNSGTPIDELQRKFTSEQFAEILALRRGGFTFWQRAIAQLTWAIFAASGRTEVEFEKCLIGYQPLSPELEYSQLIKRYEEMKHANTQSG